jgi:hypothetical protein
MNISEYRDQFASFNSSLELARYRCHVGLTSEVNNYEIYDRYSALFPFDAIAELRSSMDQAPADFETERKGLQRLLTGAQFRHVEVRAGELSAELIRCESALSLEWSGAELSLEDVPAQLAGESKKSQRRELAVRWLDSISVCDDLRLARLKSLNESARWLGFASYRELICEVTDTNSHAVQQAAWSLLEQTESAYKSALTKLVAREVPEVRPGDLDFADLPYFEALPWLDRYLPAKNLRRTHAETMKGMGIRVAQQPNIQIDVEPRPGRNRAAACFPVRPPEDVRLAVPPNGGASDFLNGLQQSGKTQYYAWCSKSLATRHPEFVYSPDSGTGDACGYLFRYLALDPKWILEFLPEVERVRAGELAKDVSIQMALQIRRLCADALFEIVAYDEGQSSEQLQSAYVDMYERATSFSMRPEPFLLNLQTRTQPGCQLRALAFSFGLREYLRVRYGHRWWSSRKAGDELIDLWSTASRYSVEELAPLVGFGELSFDLLAETMNTALMGDLIRA